MEQRNEFTYRLLSKVLKSGMRVLDIGCGIGEVTNLAAQLVGDTGQVVGIDKNEVMIAMAKAKNLKEMQSQIQFEVADLMTYQDERKFDVILGRRVLMYLADSQGALKHLTHLLKPGGYFVFQESDAMSAQHTTGKQPLHNLVQALVWETVAKEGGQIFMGSKLFDLFRDTGLTVDTYISENIIQTAQTGSDMAFVFSMMQERMSLSNVHINPKINPATLEADLAAELANSQAYFLRDVTFGIVGRVKAEKEWFNAKKI